MGHMLELAQARQQIKERHGVATRRIDPNQRDVDLHVAGVCAEYAVAKLLGLVMDESVSRAGNKRGWELALPGGMTIDVKYRAKRGWDYALKGSDPAEFKADIGVLVWPGLVREPATTFEVIGWISRTVFGLRSEEGDFKFGPRLFVRAARMTDMQHLEDHIRCLQRSVEIQNGWS